jgi:hypothetical protein
MKYAIIAKGIVTNIAVADPEFAAQQGWIECPEGVDIGWSFDGQTATPPVEIPQPEPTPPTKEELLAQLNALSAQIQALE